MVLICEVCVVGCLLVVVWSVLRVVFCLLFASVLSFVGVFAVCCLLCNVCCVLRVVCCLLCVVSRVLLAGC